MPAKSPGITKNPPCGHLVFILFSQVLKKASAQPPTKRANRSPHCWFACSMVRPFNSFHSLRLLRSASVHSCVPVAHAPVTATLAWHFVPCSLRSHSFASLLRSLTHFTHFTSAPFTCFSHMSSFLLAISTIRVASQWDK